MANEIETILVCAKCGMGVQRIERIPSDVGHAHRHNVVDLVEHPNRLSPCGEALKRKENNDAPDSGLVCANR